MYSDLYYSDGLDQLSDQLNQLSSLLGLHALIVAVIALIICIIAWVISMRLLISAANTKGWYCNKQFQGYEDTSSTTKLWVVSFFATVIPVGLYIVALPDLKLRNDIEKLTNTNKDSLFDAPSSDHSASDSLPSL